MSVTRTLFFALGGNGRLVHRLRTGVGRLRRCCAKPTTAEARRAPGCGSIECRLPLSGPALLVLILTRRIHGGSNGRVESRAGSSLRSLGIVVALGIGFGLVMPRLKSIAAALPDGAMAALPADAC